MLAFFVSVEYQQGTFVLNLGVGVGIYQDGCPYRFVANQQQRVLLIISGGSYGYMGLSVFERRVGYWSNDLSAYDQSGADFMAGTKWNDNMPVFYDFIFVYFVTMRAG